jgi:DNA-binding response OmpR family regulator
VNLGPVRIDLDDRSADVEGRRVDLTVTETQIVRYLAERLGQTVERERLLLDLWGVPDAACTRTLDNHVARLRKKIERDPSRPQLIETVHGSGYRLRALSGRDDSGTGGRPAQS